MKLLLSVLLIISFKSRAASDAPPFPEGSHPDPSKAHLKSFARYTDYVIGPKVPYENAPKDIQRLFDQQDDLRRPITPLAGIPSYEWEEIKKKHPKPTDCLTSWSSNKRLYGIYFRNGVLEINLLVRNFLP